MKDLADLIFAIVIIIGLVSCYHRLSLLSHRIDMITIVQQSQQKYIDKLVSDKNESY